RTDQKRAQLPAGDAGDVADQVPAAEAEQFADRAAIYVLKADPELAIGPETEENLDEPRRRGDPQRDVGEGDEVALGADQRERQADADDRGGHVHAVDPVEALEAPE